MRNLVFVERIEHAESLLAELKAIDFWNRSYCQCRHHEGSETIAFANRLRRRIEILSELVMSYSRKSVMAWRIRPSKRRRKQRFLGLISESPDVRITKTEEPEEPLEGKTALCGTLWRAIHQKGA